MQVNEIFKSISGEVGDIPQGAVAWFIRFQGCNCNCAWCDTPESLALKTDNTLYMSPEQIAGRIPFQANVVLTGGEPLLQDREALEQLVNLLHLKNCCVQIETNGTKEPFLPICHVFDYKTPGSGEQNKMISLPLFMRKSGTATTWIKFVIKDQLDLDFSISVLKCFMGSQVEWQGVRIALSIDLDSDIPHIVHSLTSEIPGLEHRLVFNVQLHKHLNMK